MVLLRLPIPNPPREIAPKPAERAGPPLQRIGSGRSAIVYRKRTAKGDIVHKRFGGDSAARLVMQVLTGAPSPYEWNRDAVQCALLRRKILRVLLRFWFDGKVSTPRPLNIRATESPRAFSLQMEYVRGKHLPLWHGLGKSHPDRLRRLLADVMQPLQQRLKDAGFVGLIWQAGLGNPVAAGNFMLRNGHRERWSWVDLESGVPALFPLNPSSLFGFYLPECLRRRRVLFDDVDIATLRGYLGQIGGQLNDKLGAGVAERLNQLVMQLEYHQTCWKSLSRTQAGVGYYRSQQRFGLERAAWYEQHPVAWNLKLLSDALTATAEWAFRTLRQLFQPATLALLLQAVIGCGRYFLFQRTREHWAKRYVHRRIAHWRNRRFLTRRLRRELWSESKTDESLQCVNDLLVHTASKLPAKILQCGLIPLLVAVGWMGASTAAVLLLASGPLLRTMYTAWRCTHAIVSRKRIPWVAFLTGLLPIVGTAAFAWQFLYWNAKSPQQNQLPQFLVADTFATIGRNIPIWGGQDSLVEAWFNRLPRPLFRLFSLRT
jgi:hypothetical protein